MLYLVEFIEYLNDLNGSEYTIRSYSILDYETPDRWKGKKNTVNIAKTDYPVSSLFGRYYLECLKDRLLKSRGKGNNFEITPNFAGVKKWDK